MRIGVITFHRAYNCGAMLQAWALKTVLERMGHVVRFLESNELGRIPPIRPWSIRNRDGTLIRRIRSAVYRGLQTLRGDVVGVRTGVLYDEFRENFLPESECDDAEVGKEFDLVISGSDQVLSPDISGWTPHFLCHDVPDAVPKIMYAGSAGDNAADCLARKLIASDLKRFTAVSVREPYADYDVVLDPTLLMQQDDYLKLCKDQSRIVGEHYLYVYTCTCSDFEVGVARYAAKKLGLRLVLSNPWGRYLRKDIPEFVRWMSPELMIRYIRDADCVIAGSFHATVMSILFNKAFISIRQKEDVSSSRSAMFLNRYGISNRIVNPKTKMDQVLEGLKVPMPLSMFDRLREDREMSMKWLVEAIRKCESNI